MIGAFINTVKGVKENSDLKKRLNEVNKQLSGIDSIDSIMEQIDNPYDRVIAKNQVLLSKYYKKRTQHDSIAQLQSEWEMVKKEMTANIEQTEQQLQQMAATKLDIARIVASLSQLSNEFDLELQKIKSEVSNPQLDTSFIDLQYHPFLEKLQQKELLQTEELALLKGHVNDFIAKYEALKKSIAKVETSQITLVKELQNDVKSLQMKEHTLTDAVDQVNTTLSAQAALIDSAYKQMEQLEEQTTATMNELDSKMLKKSDALMQKIIAANEEVIVLEQKLGLRIEEAEQQLERQIESLQKQLQNQKSAWTARAAAIDEAIQTQAVSQKKALMQWTIPLYVLVIGIIGFIIFN